MKNATVGIVKCISYNTDEVYNAVQKAISVCPFPDVKGKSVLVKPNILSDADPSQCITTNPEVVRSVIRVLKEKGASTIYCGDSPGLHSSSFEGKKCGINQICREEGAIWCNFAKDPVSVRVENTNQTVLMAGILKNTDYVISVCKFKTHQLMYSTGAVKNLFGVIPGLNKSQCHVKNPSRESFAKFIVGVHQTVKPAFCVMDAVIGMEGPGPANGYPRAVNCILASDNCFAMDIAQATIMGYSPDDIPILNEAKRQSLLPQKISYPLLNPETLVIKDFKRVKIAKKTHFFKSLILPFFTRGLAKKQQQKETPPSFVKDRCIKCKRCVNICPAKALTLTSGTDSHIEIDTSKCIRCYCCHEMCPADAIEIGKLDE